MSSSSTWSYSLKAFPLLMVIYLFMAWPNFTARDPKLVPVDCGNFHDSAFIFLQMRRSCCSQGKKQITLLSSVYLRPHFPLRSQQLIAYCEWQHFVFLNTGSKTITTTVLYKDENFLLSGFYCNRSHHGNVTTPLRFLFIFVFLCTGSFFKKSLKGVCTCHNCLNYVIV